MRFRQTLTAGQQSGGVFQGSLALGRMVGMLALAAFRSLRQGVVVCSVVGRRSLQAPWNPPPDRWPAGGRRLPRPRPTPLGEDWVCWRYGVAAGLEVSLFEGEEAELSVFLLESDDDFAVLPLLSALSFADAPLDLPPLALSLRA